VGSFSNFSIFFGLFIAHELINEIYTWNLALESAEVMQIKPYADLVNFFIINLKCLFYFRVHTRSTASASDHHHHHRVRHRRPHQQGAHPEDLGRTPASLLIVQDSSR
jgi:hypothetical protein